MEKWHTPGSGAGHVQNKTRASISTRKQENQGLIRECQKNKGATLKSLPLIKSGVISAPNRIMNVTDYTTTQHNPSP